MVEYNAKVMLYLCFTLFIVLLLFVELKIQFYLDTDAQVNFNVYQDYSTLHSSLL